MNRGPRNGVTEKITKQEAFHQEKKMFSHFFHKMLSRFLASPHPDDSQMRAQEREAAISPGG